MLIIENYSQLNGKETCSAMSIRKWIVSVAVIVFVFFLFLTWTLFDADELFLHLHTLLVNPKWIVIMFGAYLLSFMLKAQAWRMYAGSQGRFRIYYHGIIYSLLVNHLLPLKAGDIVRTGFLMNNARKTWDEAIHSVAIMRLLDMFVLGVISAIGVACIGLSASWEWIVVLLSGILVLAVIIRMTSLHRVPFVRKHWKHFKAIMLSRNGLFVIILVTASWIMEAGVIYGIARIVQLNLSAVSIVWANSITIAGQVLHITPGGIGTYESTLSGSLVVLGIGWKEAYAAALLSHAFKFVFAYAVGSYTMLRMPIRLPEMRAWIKNKQKPAKERTSS